MISDPRGTIARSIAAGKSNPQIFEDLYLAAFSRRPRLDEMAAMKAHLRKQPQRRPALEDILWALFNHKEFIFIH